MLGLKLIVFALFAYTHAQDIEDLVNEERAPRLFMVSTTTATTITTSTSTLATKTTCVYAAKMNVATTTCPNTGRKKRSLVIDGDDISQISISRLSKDGNKKTVPAEISSTKVEEKDRRKAKFVLYYMTTTLTSTSTSISTSSSYTATYTISLLKCTPSGVLEPMCG